MQYVDGFVLPVPKKNLKAYKALAKLACKVWLDHGALDYRECVAEDVKPGKLTSFPHRDAVMAKVMKDPRLAKMMDPKKMPFDAKRMFFGGFDTIVTA